MSKGKTGQGTVAQEAATEGAKVPVVKMKKKGDLMYLGPTIIGAARRGTVFRNGILPKKAQECIAEFPQMDRLFVEMDRIPEAVREIRKKQGVLKTIYAQVEAHFGAQKP